jgi:predicted DNA-binding helix-hairpin-helix protein
MQFKKSPAPLRVPRLYQSQFLINSYNFNPDELILDDDGNLLLEEDPKYLWAKSHPEIFPIEINDASFSELIKVPGIGIKSAQKIISARRSGFKFKNREDLKKIGVVVLRADPFIQIGSGYQSTLI